MKKVLFSFFLVSLIANGYKASSQETSGKYPFQNYELPLEDRVTDLVSRMTLKEKADQLLYTAPAIPRLGIP